MTFRFVKARQIACLTACDLLKYYPAVGDHFFDRLLHPLGIDADQLRGGRRKFSSRDEAVSASGVVLQFKDGRCGEAVFALQLDAELQRHGVGLGKASADMRRGQDIGVFLQDRHRAVGVITVHTDREDRPQSEGTDELHQTAHAGLPSKSLGHLRRFLKADALDLRKFLGRTLKNVERFVPKAVDKQQRGCRADAAHRSPRKIIIDRGGGGGQHPLGEFRLELPAVNVVRGPSP